MNAYRNISNELRSFFDSHRIFRLLMPLDIVIMLVGLVLLFLINVGLDVGSFVGSLAFWIYILGLLLTYANLKEQFLYIGLLGYGVTLFLRLLIDIFGRFHTLNWSALFGIIIYGGLGYLVLKKALVKSTQANFKG